MLRNNCCVKGVLCHQRLNLVKRLWLGRLYNWSPILQWRSHCASPGSMWLLACGSGCRCRPLPLQILCSNFGHETWHRGNALSCCKSCETPAWTTLHVKHNTQTTNNNFLISSLSKKRLPNAIALESQIDFFYRACDCLSAITMRRLLRAKLSVGILACTKGTYSGGTAADFNRIPLLSSYFRKEDR